jgi:ABC-type ATPase with predicted acetyltransferase domain
MPTYSISKNFRWRGRLTDKVVQVCRMFGITADRLSERCVVQNCRLEINEGDIVYITGPSGAGKSVMLKELEKTIPPSDRVNLARIKLAKDKTLIDCIDADLLTSLRMLSDVGLNDVFCILNQPVNLSEGQKYRFRLAMAMEAEKKFIFADEFCSGLDAITAAVISYNIHKFAKRTGTTFFLASSHDHMLLDLAPDVLVVKELSAKTQVIYKKRKSKDAKMLTM